MTAQEAAATCYFLDVGQGSSQIIDLGGGRAIVIDGGPSAMVPLSVLTGHVQAHTIVALIVSHNDADHLKGARDILTHYRNATESLYFLYDRPVEEKASKCWKELVDLADRIASTTAMRIERLERRNDIQPIFEDAVRGLSLDILYPEFLENIKAIRTGDPNASCGVLTLSCGTRRLVFSGDASLFAWKLITARIAAPIVCDIFTVPHHGGKIWDGDDQTKIEQELAWLYSNAVRTDYALVSVGTTNVYTHPYAESIQALQSKTSGSPRVLCTQITSRCCKNENPSNLSAIDLLRPGHRSAGVGGIACAGTVVALMNSKKVEVEGWEDHEAWIERLASKPNGRPLCRSAAASLS